MTLPLEQSMERERAKPRAAIAEAIAAAKKKWVMEHVKTGILGQRITVPETVDIEAALACLVSHGFITIEGLLAMKAEQEAWDALRRMGVTSFPPTEQNDVTGRSSQSPNGEARSSVGKGAGE